MTTSQQETRSNGKSKPSKQSEPVSWRTLLRMASKPGIAPATATKLRAQAAAQRPKRNTTAKLKVKPKRAKDGQMTEAEFADFINKPLTTTEKREAKEYMDERHTYSDAGDDLMINPTVDNEQVIGLKKKAQRLEGQLTTASGKGLEAIVSTLEAELERRDRALIDEFIESVAIIRAHPPALGSATQSINVTYSMVDAILKALTRK